MKTFGNIFMKSFGKLFMAAVVAAGVGAFTACSSDKLGDTIFDTAEYELDSTAYTYPLDRFVEENFRIPYNMRFLYRFQDVGSDMDYNLTPCSYDQSINLAVMCKYLWYDVYKTCVGDEFLKKYSPRVIQVIGSPAYNPSSGTIKLGTAEGGLKITLYMAEELRPNSIDSLNEYFFKTMHHEFSHILHQNINIPTDFNLISAGTYNATSWQDTPDSVAVSRGFTSPYASSQLREDFVETIANYIVKDTLSWRRLLNTARANWELADDVDATYWYKLDRLVQQGRAHRDTVGYFVKIASYSNGEASTLSIQRKAVQRDSLKYAVTDPSGNYIPVPSPGDMTGEQILLKKLSMVKEWLKSNYNYDLDSVRMMVQRRQYVTDENGNFVLDSKGNFINALTYQRADGTTLLDELRQWVLKYKRENE